MSEHMSIHSSTVFMQTAVLVEAQNASFKNKKTEYAALMQLASRLERLENKIHKKESGVECSSKNEKKF